MINRFSFLWLAVFLLIPTSTKAQVTPKVTNPDIALIGDFRAWYTSEGPRNLDMEMSEVETSFRSVIDPFARADIFIGMGHDDGEFEFELEEAYLTTLNLPYQLQAKVGKFRSNVGKINRLHPHALPFIDVPAVYANFFGDEGLNDQGASVNWLVPNSRFYQELSFEVTRGPGESESFARAEGNRMLYTSHLKNFWDLSDNASLELGISGLTGPNSEGRNTTIGGVDITYKWKPLQFNTYKSLTLQLEAFQSQKDLGASTIKANGFYALINYQLARRWFLTGRFDQADLPDNPDWNEKAVSTTLGWYLSEYQKIELGGRTSWGPDMDQSYQALVGMVFVIGTHGAHEY
ncbi:MAG: hypothetical protein O3B41_08030 [Bacteroidetes bacterium]|nr:hypothetical protein [Bacteroidota bacterium]